MLSEKEKVEADSLMENIMEDILKNHAAGMANAIQLFEFVKGEEVHINVAVELDDNRVLRLEISNRETEH